MWSLTPAQLAGYQGLFVRLQAERAVARGGAAAAESAWLRLILIAAARWAEAGAPPVAPPQQDAELAALWEVIHEHIDRPADFAGALKRRIANYDSLRHRFRKIYGLSPRDLLLRLRIDRAKHLLLESSMPVTEVSELLGYGRVHEFARIFRSHVGSTPSGFRASPK